MHHEAGVASLLAWPWQAPQRIGCTARQPFSTGLVPHPSVCRVMCVLHRSWITA